MYLLKCSPELLEACSWYQREAPAPGRLLLEPLRALPCVALVKSLVEGRLQLWTRWTFKNHVALATPDGGTEVGPVLKQTFFCPGQQVL